MNTIKTGKLGYNLVEKQLLKRNWDIYTPILEDTKIDCIIIKNNQLLKLQIKTLQQDKYNKCLPVRKIIYNRTQNVQYHYTKEDVDYFMGVDLDTEDIYVVPIEFIQNYSSSISIKTLEPYKNNFNQLEPYIGNNISGEDDIGESLTANTEGMDNNPARRD